MSSEDIAKKVLDGLEPELLDSFRCEYRCDCSKERVERALISLGREELTKMAEEEYNIEVCCHFCDKKYNFSKDEIRDLMKDR